MMKQLLEQWRKVRNALKSFSKPESGDADALVKQSAALLRLILNNDSNATVTDYGNFGMISIGSKTRGKVRPVSRLKKYFKCIRKSNTLGPYIQMSEYDPESPLLSPMTMEYVNSHPARDRILSRILHDTVPGGAMNLPLALIMLPCLLDEYCDPINHWLLRELKEYVEYVNPGYGVEYSMTKNGVVVGESCKDALIAKRLVLFVEAYEILLTSYSVKNDALLHEAFHYVFKDPDINAKNLGSMIYQPKTMAMALTQSGYRVIWEGGAEGLVAYSIKEVDDDHNDKLAYSLVEREVQKSITELQDSGCRLIAKELVRLISADVTTDNFRMVSFLESLPRLSGFTHSDRFLSMKAQLDVKPITKPAASSEKTQSIIKTLCTAVEQRGGFPSYEQALTLISTSMTSKSSGEDEPVKFTIDMSGSDLIGDGTNRKEMNVSMNSKSAYWLAYGIELLDELDGVMTDEVRLGQRYVTMGKLARMIVLVKELYYVISLLFGISLMDAIPFTTFAERFSLSHLMGRKLFDHAMGIKHSGLGDRCIFGKDFKEFDMHAQRMNAINDIEKSLLDFLATHGNYTQPWGPANTINAFGRVLKSYAGGLYSLAKRMFEDGSITGGKVKVEDYLGEFEVIKHIGLQSGHLLTAAIGTTINLSDFLYMLDELCKDQNLRDKFGMSEEESWFMGDDSSALAVVDRNKLSTQDLFDIRALMTRCSDDNGLINNPAKCLVRCFAGSYLKVEYMYGFVYGRSVTSAIVAENSVPDVANVEEMRGKSAVFSTMVARGMPPTVAAQYFHFYGILRSGIKTSHGDSHEWYYPSCMYLYSPNGVGALPLSVFGGSRDIAIAMLAKINPSFERCLNDAMTMLDVKPTDLADQATRAVSRGRTKPENVFAQGAYIAKIAVPLSRRIESSKARRRWNGRSMPLPNIDSMSVYNIGESSVRSVFQGSSTIRKIRRETRNVQAQTIYDTCRAQVTKQSIRAMFPYVFECDWEMECEVLPDDKPNPFPLLKCRLYDCVPTGFHPGIKALTGDEILRILRRDPYARKDLVKEAIMSILLHPSVSNDPELIHDALVIMGFRTDLAAQVATKFTMLATSTKFGTLASSLSFVDDVFEPIMMNQALYNTYVNVPKHPDVKMTGYIEDIALFWALQYGMMSGRFYRWKFSYYDTFVPAFNGHMYGRSAVMQRAAYLLSLYPKKDRQIVSGQIEV
jgi:hypothetical protein